MNLIFDFGNVLVDFKPLVYLKGLFSDDVLINKINEIVFKSYEWIQMDQGVLTHKEAIKVLCRREPEYKNEIFITIKNASDIVSPINETIQLLPKIKKAGHRIYYLSNMHIEIRDYLLKNHKYISLFDGGVFSCDIKMTKPSPEIYRYIINKYNLIPEECVFFDDVEENTAAAEREGIKSILFTSAADVIKYI